VVICPNCHSKFRINKDALADETVKMRCSICSHIFTYTLENNSTLEHEFDNLIGSKEEELKENLEQEEGLEDFGFEITETEEEESLEEEPSRASGVQPESVIREIDSILGSGEEVGLGKNSKVKKVVEKRTPLKVIFSVLIIILLFVFVGLWLMKDKIPFLQKTQEEFQPTVLERGPFFTIVEDSVTYEMLINNKEGSVLVIKGVIKKLTKKPLGSVMVQARVYDSNNKLIDSRSSYAGIVPDSSELTRQRSSDINTLLSAEPRTMGALSSSQDIPFAVVFFGKPALEGTSFQVEVKEFHWR
jgi:predicted Zn finger-like uncharacterized protein